MVAILLLQALDCQLMLYMCTVQHIGSYGGPVNKQCLVLTNELAFVPQFMRKFVIDVNEDVDQRMMALELHNTKRSRNILFTWKKSFRKALLKMSWIIIIKSFDLSNIFINIYSDLSVFRTGSWVECIIYAHHVLLNYACKCTLKLITILKVPLLNCIVISTRLSYLYPFPNECTYYPFAQYYIDVSVNQNDLLYFFTYIDWNLCRQNNYRYFMIVLC